MVQFANKREEERRALTGSEKAASQANDRDFLSRFLAALEKDPIDSTMASPSFSHLFTSSLLHIDDIQNCGIY